MAEERLLRIEKVDCWQAKVINSMEKLTEKDSRSGDRS